jgi:YHS domain-containing protein
MMKARRTPGNFSIPAVLTLFAVVTVAWCSAMGQDEKPDASPQHPKPTPATEKPQRAAALKGYCPAAYLLYGRPIKGDPKYQSMHRGELYYLRNAEAKKQFDADPEKFLPRFGGLCTTALGGSYLKRMPADPEVFTIHDGRVYLFTSQRVKKYFDETPAWFIARAKSTFAEPALGRYCVVSYLARNKAVKGRPEIKYLYRGWYYHFASHDARAGFIADPDGYLPQYDGFCTEGVSRNKRYPADPDMFIVHNAKTYLFFDTATRVKFMIDPEPMIEKADANWPTLKNAAPTR